ncbi:MAG: hypothetical protein ACE5JI_16195 [Acidobacteriota bacterium]
MQQPARRRTAHRQAELFEVPSDRPSWQDLPDDARKTVIQLFAQMLKQQRRQGMARPVPEVEHE